VINVQMVRGVLHTLFATKMNQLSLFHQVTKMNQLSLFHRTHIFAELVLTMPLHHVRSHARLASLMNVQMDYFALQVLHALTRAPFSVVLRGTKLRQHARCLARVV